MMNSIPQDIVKIVLSNLHDLSDIARASRVSQIFFINAPQICKVKLPRFDKAGMEKNLNKSKIKLKLIVISLNKKYVKREK
jgi:hypothetical protein